MLGKINDFYSIYIFDYRQLVFLVLVIFIIFLIGLYDDKYSLSFEKRIFYLFFVIILFANYSPQFNINFIQIDIFNFAIGINKISPLILTLSIIIFLIACNLFDGINIQSPLYFIYVIVILISLDILFELNSFLLIPLSLILYLNYKQKIFFGESGIYLASFIIAYSLIFGYKNYLISAEQIFLLISTQIYDAIRVALKRIMIGQHPAQPDKIHIHHLLLNKNH